MLKKNEIYEVDIIDNGYQGEGIAKIDNMPIFIQGAIAGERLEIKILKVQSSFAYGKIIKIIKPSTERVETECKDYNRCGGCNLRHVKYEETLKIKKATVQNCIYKSFGQELEVKDVIGMKTPMFYRNKLQYPVGVDKENMPVMGIYASRSHNIIPVHKCYIQNETCEEIARDIFEFVKNNDISTYNEETLKGTVRHIVVKIGVKTNEILVTLVLNDKNFKYDEKFIKFITLKHPNIKTIVKNYNMKNTNVILGKENEVIYGDGYIYDILGEYKFKISPLSFYQVNPIQTEVLYNKAMEYANLTGKETVFDLYCGIGTIGIFASDKAKKVYGIEVIPEAIEDAKENAKINGIGNTEFFAGEVEKILPELIDKRGISADVAFIDPPRKGCDNITIETLLKVTPQKIVYVSCNPATLARDIRLLEEKYELKQVQPVDMFPYTSSVECVVLLQFKY